MIGNAVHEAVRGADVKVMDDKLESGASTAVNDQDGDIPLRRAAWWGSG